MIASGNRVIVVDDPTIDLEYEDLEFRLTYEGQLLSDQVRGGDRNGEVKRSRANLTAS
jgi:hypothetical protein